MSGLISRKFGANSPTVQAFAKDFAKRMLDENITGEQHIHNLLSKELLVHADIGEGERIKLLRDLPELVHRFCVSLSLEFQNEQLDSQSTSRSEVVPNAGENIQETRLKDGTGNVPSHAGETPARDHLRHAVGAWGDSFHPGNGARNATRYRVVSIIFLVAVALCPVIVPWKSRLENRNQVYEHSLGYHLLFSPPASNEATSVLIDHATLVAEFIALSAVFGTVMIWASLVNRRE